MYVVVVSIDIQPGFRERFVEALLDDARGSVTHEPGCLRFDVIQDERNPDRIYLYEVYRDKAAFDAHTRAPHFLTWRDTAKDWFASPPVVGRGSNIFPSDTDWDRPQKAVSGEDRHPRGLHSERADSRPQDPAHPHLRAGSLPSAG